MQRRWHGLPITFQLRAARHQDQMGRAPGVRSAVGGLTVPRHFCIGPYDITKSMSTHTSPIPL